MTDRAYQTLIAPLISFGQQLNIPVDVWSKSEELDRIYYSDLELSSATLESLELECLIELVQNYRDAITCQFMLGELPLLELDSSIEMQKLNEFKADIAQIDTLKLILKIDKQKILQQLFGGNIPANVTAFLYFFNSSLENFIGRGLIKLERELDLSEDKKIILLVAERSILLEGRFLSVWGGNEIFNLESLTVPTEEEFSRLKQIRHKRLNNLTWQGFELNYLTPLNFEFEQFDESTGNVADTLYNYAAQMILLYIADRSAIKGDLLIAIFNTSNKSIDVKVNTYTSLKRESDRQNIKILFDLFKWIYIKEDTSYDRYSIAQITIVQILQSLDKSDYYRAFISKAEIVLDDTRYRTKAFVENKIDDYIQQELKLEDYVINSIKNFEDEIINLIKSISETIKGAITVAIGSFVAAVLGGNFNSLIFRISLGTYIVYIAIFPFLLSTSNQHYKYKLMVSSYEQRIIRFKHNLDSEKVDTIVARRFSKITQKFRRLFTIVIILYIAIVASGILAIIYIPNLVANP